MGIGCLWQPSCYMASSNHAKMNERARTWAWTCWVGSVLPGSVHYYWIDVLLKCLLFSCTINSSFWELAKNRNSFDLFFATFTGTGEPKSDSPPVSIWRTYFVANEWNKIQTLRQISPTFQIIAVLFFLEVPVAETLLCLWVAPLSLIADVWPSDVEVLGFSNYALSEPVSTERSPQVFTPPYSMTLRYGLASILWLCLGLLQVHWHHSRCSETSFSVFFNSNQNWKRED